MNSNNGNINIIEDLKAFGFSLDRIRIDEPMSRHTSFRIGGPADYFVVCENDSELKKLLCYIKNNAIESYILGNGTNILVSDKGYRGIIVTLGGEFAQIENNEEIIIAGGAAKIAQVASFACEASLTGLEFAGGIPGSVGGAVYMNAGAYGGEIRDVARNVTLVERDGSRIYTLTADEMMFSYRHSRLEDSEAVVLSAEFKLEKGDRTTIKDKMAELSVKRNSKQPLNYPSAGSTFKRPQGAFAAALIDEAGLKGVSVGGAAVSEKHAGFIINTGGATCGDVLALMDIVKRRVYENSGIILEPEVRIIGEF